MSDSSQWQSPGGGTPPPPRQGEDVFAAPGGLATPPPSGFTPPQAQPGWTPPPKPGLIPLRPLTLGNILTASFQVMRRNPRPTFGISLIITGAISLLGLVVGGLVIFFAVDRSFRGATEDTDAIVAGSVALGILSFLAILAVGVVGTAILQGIISLEVARGSVGEKLRLKGLWRLARGRIGALIGWAFLASGAAFIAITAVVLVVVLLAAGAGGMGVLLAVLVALFGGLALVVVAAWIGTKLALVPSALLLERLPLLAAIRRSWSLTNGYFWRTFGILLLVNVIVNLAMQVITTPLSLILGVFSSLVNPNEDEATFLTIFAVIYFVTLIVVLLASAVAAIVISASVALLYIDLRIRKEGLDLELTRFVEARQAGDASVRDPYLAGVAQQSPPATQNQSPWA